jgi:hypothetical protein
MGVKRRDRGLIGTALAVLLCATAAPALAQPTPAQPTPPPPQPETTTVEEPAAPEKPNKPAPKPAEEVAHVPPDASGINLSEMDTKDLNLLYFDPAQTYLTPYIGRAFENALAFH